MAYPGEDRETFMQRVREPLGRTAGEKLSEPAPEVDESLARLAGADDDLPAMFARNAETLGMFVQQLTTSELGERLRALLDELEARRIVFGVGAAVEQQLGVSAQLDGAAVEPIDWAEARGMSPQFDADAGITDVHAALAETGTLICCTDARHARGLSLAPPRHIALVRASDIIPDMIDYWQRLKGLPAGELPSSQAFITGPSKTADIEGELIKGVHGPGQVHILIIDDA